jgi:Methane oxygenase PmoA
MRQIVHFNRIRLGYLHKTPALLLLCLLPMALAGQKASRVEVVSHPASHDVRILVGKKLFAELLYPDSLEKPVLYDICAPNGQIITRGFPLHPRDQEPTDHPHHVGLWLNYEDVNGLDFWNNSYAIAPEKKHTYGWIKVDSLLQARSGKPGIVQYRARWEDQQKDVLIRETTTYLFTDSAGLRIIDRITSLSAAVDLSFADAKDGLLGLRLNHHLELVSAQPKQFTDNRGNATVVQANAEQSVSGNYLTSEGKQGDSAWGTRAVWCMLYGKVDPASRDSTSIVIIDHPANPGYPTYWHARGYGLFAANPLGQKIFSNGKEALNFKLAKGNTVTFRYRIVLASGKNVLDPDRINGLARAFASQK